MSRCLQLAQAGLYGAAPNPMVGAVIVHKGEIIGEGYHIHCGGPHAEVNAINSVKKKDLLKESTIYVSLEPCAHYGKTPPCADLIIREGIPHVVIGCTDPFAKVNGLGIKKLTDAGIDVKTGILEQECMALNKRFFTFHLHKRPYITLKWAESADGFIDGKRPEGETGHPVKLSNSYTQMLVHRLRSINRAILVGTRTAIADNPALTNRTWPGPAPLRLVIDREGKLPDTLQLFDGSTPTRVYLGSEAARPDYLNHPNTEGRYIDFKENILPQIMDDLYQHQIQSLLVEGGKQLLESFINNGLWDEIYIEQAPVRLYEGTPAPQIPSGLTETSVIDDHQLLHITNKAQISIK